MTDTTEMLKQRWEAFKGEVLAKGWPADQCEALSVLLELSFYGGALCAVETILDEGSSPQVIRELSRELAEHKKRTEEHVRVVERLQGFLLQVEVSEIVVHEAGTRVIGG